MADNQVSTPQSSNEPDNTSKVPKDRSCPFCGQAFTSSSLGRHLDLYIRPKNPKPPDGVHDVDEIRRIRGNITRRQSRVASVKRDPSTPAAAPAATNNGPEDGTPAKVISSPTGGIGERYESLLGVRLNKPGWESTGVINDLPPRPQQKPEPRKESSKHAHLKVELEQRRGIAEELDNGRAAELALQEVLQSVRDANAQQSGRGLFEFDFFGCNFPSLCLRLLATPPTVHSATPFATSKSWSFHPPWEQQYEALKCTVEERGKVFQRQWQALSTQRPASLPPHNIAERSDVHKFLAHIDDAFSHWKHLDANQRQEAWQQEILRSYARAEEGRKEAQNTIDSLRRQIDHLSSQLEKANTGWTVFGQGRESQYPLFYSPYSPLTSLRLSNDLMRELCRQGVDFRDWDYERLTNKWKTAVQDERKAANGLGAQRSFFDTPHHHHHHRQSTASFSQRVLNGTSSTVSRSASTASAISAAPATRTNSMDSESRDADAEGEDDDVELNGDDTATEIRGESQQHHVAPQKAVEVPNPPSSQLSARQCRDQVHTGQNIAQQQQSAYGWPLPHSHQAQSQSYSQGMKSLPPGPNDWRREMNHAAMEGLEGPAIHIQSSGS